VDEAEKALERRRRRAVAEKDAEILATAASDPDLQALADYVTARAIRAPVTDVAE
jgi:hypothetical protein